MHSVIYGTIFFSLIELFGFMIVFIKNNNQDDDDDDNLNENLNIVVKVIMSDLVRTPT